MSKRLFAAIPGLKGVLLALCCTLSLYAGRVFAQTQDIQIVGGTNPYITIGRGLAWGGGGPGNIGNNFIFQPVSPDEGFCLFITNNNPTNAHSVTVTVSQTGDPALTTFIGNTAKWNTVATTTSFPISVPASSISGVNYKTSASAGIRIGFTGNTTQAGSPDTADVFAVQTTQSSCGALPSNAVQGPYVIGSLPTALQKFPVLVGGIGTTGSVQMQNLGSNNGTILDGSNFSPSILLSALRASNSFNEVSCLATSGGSVSACTINAIPVATWGGQTTRDYTGGFLLTNILEEAMQQQVFGAATVGFNIQASTVNPGAGAAILHSFNVAVSTIQLAYKTAILSCSAACELKIQHTTARGVTCTNVSVNTLDQKNTSRPTANASDVAETACGTQPTAGEVIADLFLAANSVQTVDLSGFISSGNVASGGGIEVIAGAALTGTASATMTLAEQPK
jgi:hypothetical protein